MKIYLKELSDQETELDFSESETWVKEAVEAVDESLDDVPGAIPKRAGLPRAPREIHTHFSLRKVDDVIVVSGDVKTHIELVCSRCATLFKMPCSPHFSALFCDDPVMAGVGHLESQGKPAGQNKGFARHAHDEEADSLAEDGKDLDITYLSSDYIDLRELVTEQLQLQVPFQPLCKADCKGMCSNCGADLNVGRCACAKLGSANAFQALKNLKL
ncbi:MAG: DUF177 domain-containing protein [Oligoflexia bacterium]|nr:DUF177 domain-containing protein [Oligoflexia bacterium]